MGVVFVAEEESTGKRVALKRIRPRGEFEQESMPGEGLARFEREIRQTIHLNDPGHPGIVQVHEVGMDDGVPYYTMEIIRGRSLDLEIPEGGMDPVVAATILRRVSQAVEYAHAHPGGGVIHRDIKPHNILIDETGQPHLIDFGLATDFASRDEDLGEVSDSVLGTPDYMSPEQASMEKELGAATDIYSLGATFYHALVGRAPFRGGSLPEIQYAILNETVPAPHAVRREVSPAISRVCAKAMARDPAERYRSAADLAADLGRALQGHPVTFSTTSGFDRIAATVRRHPVQTAVLTLLLLGAACFALVLDWRSRSDERTQDQRVEALMATLRERLGRERVDGQSRIDLYRALLHRPESQELKDWEKKVEQAFRAARPGRAEAALKESEQALEKGDVWSAWVAWLRARAYNGTPSKLKSLRGRIESFAADHVPVGATLRNKRALSEEGWVLDRGWPEKPTAAAGWVCVGQAWYRTRDLHADGWIEVGGRWYRDEESAREDGCFLYQGVLVHPENLRAIGVVLGPGNRWDRLSRLRGQGYSLDGGEWVGREALLRNRRAVLPLGSGRFLWAHEATEEERADSRKRFGAKVRVYSPSEMAARGYLLYSGRWEFWETLIRSGQAALSGQEGRKARSLHFVIDPVLGVQAQWER